MMLIDRVDLSFTLRTAQNQTVRLADLVHGPLVLIFLRHLA